MLKTSKGTVSYLIGIIWMMDVYDINVSVNTKAATFLL